MLRMIKGTRIKDFDKLNEEYEINKNIIISNVNVDNVLNIFYDFIDMHSGLFFLIVEIPTNLVNEHVSNNVVDKVHKDVYYIDKMSKESINEVLNRFGNLFINDGLAQIGIGSHDYKAEIITDKYNIIRIYSGNNNINNYETIFIKNKIKKVNSIRTAWDFFTKEEPGYSICIEENGKNVFDVLEILKNESGLYFFERRED